MHTINTYRLLFLGAGFSHLAGLPLGPQLFKEVRKRISKEHSSDNHVERDLKRFIDYTARCFGREILPIDVDLEEFLGFLDVEHYLGLKGKDTWSSEGNESQLMIRKAIGQVISSKTPKVIPEAYRRFAAQLNSTDYICTFNYDTLLEQALDSVGVPYRLFPLRYSEIHPMSCIIDSDTPDELVIIKLHGSIDWFSRKGYDEFAKLIQEDPSMDTPEFITTHPIFGQDAIVNSIPLTDGPRPKNDTLLQLYRALNVDVALEQPFWKCTPFILSPSATKLFYAEALMEFWRGLQRSGGTNLSLGIIGYSLPDYDNYAMQVLYHIARNYQYFEQDLEYEGRKKTKIRIVDHQSTYKDQKRFRKRYRFLDWERTEALYTGFESSSADWILR